MSHDTWIHRIVRVAVRPLSRTAVTPNQVTSLRLLGGLAAAVAFAEGSELWARWGGLIFLASMFLDRADGELARLSGKTSPLGHSYDLVSDSLCNALAFAALGLGLYRAGLDGWYLLLGVAAGLAIAAILWLVIQVERLEGARGAELAGAAGFDPDDAMIVVPLAVWIGITDWLVAAAGFGAPLFALFMFVRFRRALATER